MISGGLRLKEEKELTVNPLLCELATATPVANDPNAFFRSSVLNCLLIRF